MIVGVFNLAGFGIAKAIKKCFDMETYEELQESKERELEKTVVSPNKILAKSVTFVEHENLHYMNVEISRASLKNTPMTKPNQEIKFFENPQ